MMGRASLLLVVCAGLAGLVARAERIEELSSKKFDEVVIQEKWGHMRSHVMEADKDGATVASFSPPTEPGDQQPATMWAQNARNMNELSAILVMSVGGLGRKDAKNTLYWVVASEKTPITTSVTNAGSDWRGFAVAFHLYGGSQHDPDHNDVRVVVKGNPNHAQEAVDDGTYSCKVDFAFEKVMMKIMVYQKTLFVFTSEHANSEWKECTVTPLDLPEDDDLDNARMGFVYESAGDAEANQVYYVHQLDVDTRWDMAGARPMEDHASEAAIQGVEGRDEWQHMRGHMDGASPDLKTDLMKLRDAKQWCQSNADCQGFTFTATDDGESQENEYEVHFKATTAWSASDNWHSYIQGHLQAVRHGAAGEAGEEKNMAEQIKQMELHEWSTEKRIQHLEKSISDKITERITALEKGITDVVDSNLMSRIEQLEEDVTKAAHTTLTARIKKLEDEYKSEVESNLMKHVEDLERKLDGQLNLSKETLDGDLDKSILMRLKTVEDQLNGALTEKISRRMMESQSKTRDWVAQVAQKLDKRAGDGLTSMKQAIGEEVGASARGWVLPFCILIGVLFLFAVFGYMWYREQKKQHLL